MFEIQVQIKEYNAGAMINVWKDVHPTNGPAYEYKTRDEAESAARKLYPLEDGVRVVELR